MATEWRRARHRDRYLALLTADEIALSDKMLEAEMPFLFWGLDMDGRRRTESPAVRSSNRLESVASRVVLITLKGWDSKWAWDRVEWRLQNVEHPYGYYFRPSIIPSSPSQPEYIAEGRFSMYFTHNDREGSAKVRQFYRTVSKISSNKRQLRLRWTTREEIARDEKGSRLWIGHHAREWLEQSPDRYAAWGPHGIGVRPVPEEA